MDDPKDIRKTDHIKALIKMPNIHLSVGIKEDIEQYIKRFYEQEQSADSMESSLDLDETRPGCRF